MISIEAYRAAIGRYYSKARSLSNNCSQQFNYCGCKKYEKNIYKLSHYDSVFHKFFNNSSVHKGKELPVGTYYYLIDLGDNMPKYTGPITLMR